MAADSHERVPEQLWRAVARRELDYRALLAWCALSSFADRRTGQAWPAESNLSKRSGLVPQYMRSVLRDLERHGFVEIVQPGLPRSFPGTKATTYWLKANYYSE